MTLTNATSILLKSNKLDQIISESHVKRNSINARSFFLYKNKNVRKKKNISHTLDMTGFSLSMSIGTLVECTQVLVQI